MTNEKNGYGKLDPSIPIDPEGIQRWAADVDREFGRVEEFSKRIAAGIDERALAILRSGSSVAIGPIEFEIEPDYPVPPGYLPPKTTARCKIGPVSDDFEPPHGWRFIRYSDWIAAGRPGLHE